MAQNEPILIGENSITLNEETMNQILEWWLNNHLFRGGAFNNVTVFEVDPGHYLDENDERRRNFEVFYKPTSEV